MADTRLSSSISSLRQKLLDQIPSANPEQLKRIARSARNLGHTQDTDIEDAINTRANTLIVTADVTESEAIAAAINQVDDSINPNITVSGTTATAAGTNIVTSDSAPGNPEDGDLWFKTDEMNLYIYYDDGTSSQWIQSNAPMLGGDATITTSDTAPANPINGSLWFDTTDLLLYIYYLDGESSQWIQTSGFSDAGGVSDISDLTDSTGLLGSGSGGATVYADMTALIAATGMSNGDFGLVTANNNIYIYNGVGWYKIATVQNDAPSAITGVDGTYELAMDGTATTITAVSTDPEGFPLTWSYSASGLGNIATISQVDNAFTITPSTTIADAGTFSLTINVTDGTNGAVSTSTNLTLEFIVIVANSRYTTLLATATGTSDNNNITDASSNNHTITVGGDARAGTFSPYRSRGYSTYFEDTAANVLYASPSSDFAFGTGAFTISVWVKLLHQYLGTIFDTNDGTNPGVMMAVNNITFYTYSNTWLSSTSTSSQDVWQHFCWTRDGSGNNKVFVNGTQATTFTDSTDYTSQNFKMGEEQNGTNDLKAYIKDLHIVKGYAYEPDSTYADGAAEPTTGTVFLGCGLPYHGDKSSSPKTLTIANSGISIVNDTPHDYIEYSAANHGGSVYFDGTGDYLTTTSSNYSLGSSSAFTFEFWYRFDDFLSSPATIFDYYDGSGNNINKLAITSSNVYLYDAPVNANILAYATEHQSNIWYHFCWTRDASNNHVFYINGQQVGTSTSSTNLNGEILDFGRRAGTYNNTFMKGHLSDISLIKGSVTRTSNFTPPTAPLSSSGSELHIKGTDASIIDKSQNANLKLVGNTTGSTTQVKFASTKSMYFDGTGDRATATGVPDLGDDFTIECWVYSTTTGNRTIVSSVNNVGSWSSNGYWSFYVGGGNYPQLQIDDSSYTGADTTLPTDQWVHLAVTRTSNTVRYFINGSVNPTTFSNSRTLKNPSGIVIGSGPNNNYIYNYTGYIQDLRISNECKYTANFTPPTAPLEG
jgi:hypothetical protein